MKNLRRRDVLLAAAAASLANPLLAADPLKLVVPYPAGGPADIVGRTFAQYFAEELGRALLIDNRAGASGSIGATAVAQPMSSWSIEFRCLASPRTVPDDNSIIAQTIRCKQSGGTFILFTQECQPRERDVDEHR